ncbi:hypothetical protein [Legionella septentrionalis]|uniref:hypothetical protein n=1 Tax=Legionella septentrionalis TaxID=2498109 RepID=UPI000F8D2A36|nr:hypothetical protein [Legionella septentrionalis]RUR10350.1 hypothetical protein ELY14_05620 [Legionella septentrionalis]
MDKNLEKIANPLKFYKHPFEVENDAELSIDDKIKLLTNWLDDIELRQVAEEENMPASNESRHYTAEVEKLLHKYQQEKAAKVS